MHCFGKKKHIRYTHMLRIQHHSFFLFLIFLSGSTFCLNVTDLQLESVMWYNRCPPVVYICTKTEQKLKLPVNPSI